MAYVFERILQIAIMSVMILNLVFIDATFELSVGSQTFHCPANASCHKLCLDAEPCAGHRFECDCDVLSCDVLCVGADSCTNATFSMSAARSSVRCADSDSCHGILFECGSADTELERCAFQAETTSISASSLIRVQGSVDRLSMVLLDAEERTEASCSRSAEDSFECAALSCVDSACAAQLSATSKLNPLQEELECSTTSSLFVLVAVLMSSMLLSAVLLYGCLECLRRLSGSKPSSMSVGKFKANGSEVNQESSHFARKFMLTLITHLFGSQSKHDALNCGILLVPEERSIDSLLRALKIEESRQCKVPVTHQFLRHYGGAASISVAGKFTGKFLIVQSGYIYAHEVSASDYSADMMSVARSHGCVLIDCARKRTRGDTSRWYLHVRVMGERVRTAADFVSQLKKNGIAVEFGVADEERTRTWRARESMRLDSSFNRAAHNTNEESTVLAQAIAYLEMQRTATEHAEDVGATIVVIPTDKKLSDYGAYLRQYLPVSMEVNGGTLLSIFAHMSPLHDGAIFVRGDRIIAVKAFFRLTGDSDSVSIGHGTRHASAKEFSKHAFKHRTFVLVLSEEDGLLRSAVNGKLLKMSTDNIGRLVAEQQLRHRDGRPGRPNNSKTKVTKKEMQGRPEIIVRAGNHGKQLELPSTTTTPAIMTAGELL